MDDDGIMELFFARAERAVIELEAKYGRLCRKISYNILNNALDAEECVNDAYLGVWNSIPPNRPNQLPAYLCRIVRNISIKRYYANTAVRRNSCYDMALEEIENCLAGGNLVEEALDGKELAQMIERFLDSMTDENRVIFMRRYWFADSCREIGERVGLTEKNVSVRLTRIRRQMKKYLTERGVQV